MKKFCIFVEYFDYWHHYIKNNRIMIIVFFDYFFKNQFKKKLKVEINSKFIIYSKLYLHKFLFKQKKLTVCSFSLLF